MHLMRRVKLIAWAHFCCRLITKKLGSVAFEMNKWAIDALRIERIATRPSACPRHLEPSTVTIISLVLVESDIRLSFCDSVRRRVRRKVADIEHRPRGEPNRR